MLLHWCRREGCYIACYHKLALPNFVAHIAIVNSGNSFENLSTAFDFQSFMVEKTKTESLEHTHASVVCGTAANTEQYSATTTMQGIANQLARSERGGNEGVALNLLQEWQATRSRHLDNGCRTVNYTVASLDRAEQRVANRSLNIVATSALD